MFAKFPEYKGLNLSNIAKQILQYWGKNDIFKKSVSSRKGKAPYIFYEGPPSANGLPGVHHVLARTIKDIFPRYKTMKGFQVKRKAGWDTHGLPVELGVEKELGITKEDIGTKITIEDYNEACKKAVMRYTDIWNDLTEKMGYWVDMDNPYITYKSKYIETVWWLLKQIYNKSLLYKGYSVQPYSPKAGTGLSSHELNQPGTYQDVTDTTVVAQFKATKESKEVLLRKIKGNLDLAAQQQWENHNLYFLAWTTTPWTLPSNTALTVNPRIKYVAIETYNQYTKIPIIVILAENLTPKYFEKKYENTIGQFAIGGHSSEKGETKNWRIVSEFYGSALLELRYEQLLDYALPHNKPENAFRVIAGDFVTTDEGTGIVHTAPTFGADDAMVAKQAKPEVPPLLVKDKQDNLVPLVDLQGKFRPEMGEFAGKYVKNEYYNATEKPEKSVDVELAIKLKTENKAFKVEKYKHTYPNCWRTDKPILYYPLNSWFIKVTEVSKRMAELNKTINWKPKSTGKGRFSNWLNNANDWNLSRSRFWGIPLPIWRSEDNKEEICIGSVEELKLEIKKAIKAGFMIQDPFTSFEVGNMSNTNYDRIDLHKNVVDDIVLVSPSGQPMTRESDLIDVWFDSGSMPYAQWHYPFENAQMINCHSDLDLGSQGKQQGLKQVQRQKLGNSFPADFIAEGVDQTRGWFYTLHTIATIVFDSVAFRNVVSNGLVLDKNGQKMSKRMSNAIDPFEILATHGADATRWYMTMNSNPWDNLKFDIAGIIEVSRKFFGTLYNTYSFFSLYANIDGFRYNERDLHFNERPELDRWILSELNTLIKNVDAFYTDYEPTKAARAISNFTQDYLSNWYVRLSRRRFWKGDYQTDKISAYQTLYTCMINIAKLGAPIAPFYMDSLYLDLNRVTQKESFESVHLAKFPVVNEAFIDKALERKMESAQTISSLVLSLRAKEKIKVRQPLQKIIIPIDSIQQKLEIEAVSDLITHEVNVKHIELLEQAPNILVKQIKPNFKTLGPRFGKDMKIIASKINSLNANEIEKIEQNGRLVLEIKGKSITIEREDVNISSKDIEGWLVANQNGLTVALDITISEDLRHEGIARELINRIQNLRKDSGFEVTDKINVTLEEDTNIIKAIAANQTYIKTETLAKNIEIVDTLEEGIPIIFDNITTKLFIQKH